MAALARPDLRLALAGLGWCGGAALQLQQPALWPAAVYAAFAAAGTVAAFAALAFARAGRETARAAATLLLAAALAAASFGATGWRAGERLAERLAPALEGVDLELTGTIAALPRVGLTGTRFVFEVEAARRDGTAVELPRRISLGWFRGVEGDALLLGPGVELRAGQRWRLNARLKAPHGPLNPHGFDLELWLFEQRIGATGQVRATPGAPALRLDAAAAHPVERLRQRLRDAIEARVADPSAAGVLAALAIGDQAAIERDDWETFRATGVAHLMAISGLHVTMFAWLAGAAVGRLWRLSPRLPLRLPAPHAARWGGLACAAAYALLAGWGVPAQRTVWMLATVVVLRTLGVRWPAGLVLGAAAVVVTTIDPWALLQPGFWLSFAAVGLLMVAAPGGDDAAAEAAGGGWPQRLRRLLAGGLRTQWVATVGLAPLTLLFFQQLSLVGFVANLVAIPLVTAVVTPLALAGALWAPLWSAGAVAVQALARLLEALAGSPLAVWSVAAAPAWAAAAGLLGGALAVAPLPPRLRLLGIPLLLPLLVPAVPRPPEGRFEAVAVDVGQGTAVLVRTRGHLLVYDAGPSWGPDSDAGARVLAPLLRARGERRIDTLLLSHRDSDHVGGAASLLATFPVTRVLSSLEDGHPLRATPPPHARCAAGARWSWDGVAFELLHPPDFEYAQALPPNARSCVLRIEDAAGASLLLAGDIEAAQEASLLERRRERLPSTVLLAPHHGSRSSSSAAFLDAVAPATVVVQAGYRNRFGHPAAEVLARYDARGLATVRSDRCGAWTLHADGRQRCERRQRARYWHHRPD